MKRVQGISLPRSGHHLLVSLLARYYGASFDFDSRSRETGKRKRYFQFGQFSYCENYTHCHTSPCENPDTRFSKSHDQRLILPKRDDTSYLIQVRAFEPFVKSLHNLGRQHPSKMSQEFAEKKREFWDKFMEKWVVNPPPKSLLLMRN